MVTYDVLYVEDSDIQRYTVENLMDNFGLTYKTCTTLDEMTKTLFKHKGRSFLVDRRFPTDRTDLPEEDDRNFSHAAEMIKFMYDNPQIIMLSGDKDGGIEAEKFGAKFYKKGGEEINAVLKLKEMLTSNKTYSTSVESTLSVTP